jgi:hypothetical protein
MDLVGLQIGEGVEPCHKGKIIGSFGADNVNPNLDLHYHWDFPRHGHELVPGRVDVRGRGFNQFEKNDVGDHGNGPLSTIINFISFDTTLFYNPYAGKMQKISYMPDNIFATFSPNYRLQKLGNI